MSVDRPLNGAGDQINETESEETGLFKGFRNFLLLQNQITFQNSILIGYNVDEKRRPSCRFSRNVHITSVNAHSPATYDRAFKFLQQYDRYPFHELITHKFHDLSDFLPHIKKMTQPDYLKAVMIRNE